MYNLHISGSTNNFKIKVKPLNNNSIPKNKHFIPQKNKLNQEKIRKMHKSPAHILNKSENISGAKKVFKTNLKNKIVQNNYKCLNAKKLNPLQNFKNYILKNKNSKNNPIS